MNKMNQNETDLFVSLERIKEKYLKNFEYKRLVSRNAVTEAEMQEKIRILSVMIEMVMEQNR
jgi:hypothetical protein